MVKFRELNINQKFTFVGDRDKKVYVKCIYTATGKPKAFSLKSGQVLDVDSNLYVNVVTEQKRKKVVVQDIVKNVIEYLSVTHEQLVLLEYLNDNELLCIKEGKDYVEV